MIILALFQVCPFYGDDNLIWACLMKNSIHNNGHNVDSMDYGLAFFFFLNGTMDWHACMPHVRLWTTLLFCCVKNKMQDSYTVKESLGIWKTTEEIPVPQGKVSFHMHHTRVNRSWYQLLGSASPLKRRHKKIIIKRTATRRPSEREHSLQELAYSSIKCFFTATYWHSTNFCCVMIIGFIVIICPWSGHA